MSFIRTNCNNLLLFLRPFLSLGQHQWVRVCVNAVRLVFLLLLKCVSMKTSSCALERWYGRWGGPSGRAHPYRLCQSISEQRQHLVILYESCTHTLVRWSPLELVDHRRILPCFLRNPEDHDLIRFFLALVEAVRRDHRRLLRTVCLTHTRTMPRSFLVKKYFAKQKPNYSELECQNGELKRFFFNYYYYFYSCMNYERILT